MAWGNPASLGGTAASTVTGTTATSATFTAPSSGDFLFITLTINNSGIGTFTPPSGWTAQREAQDASGVCSILLLRVADGTEGAALTASWLSGTGQWEFGNVYHATGGPASLTGIEETAVWNNVAGSNASNPYPAVAGAGATSNSNELILWNFARLSAATFSTWQAQGGMTELEDHASGGSSLNACSHTLAYKVLSANETPSAQLNLSNGTREYNGWVIALKPGSGGSTDTFTVSLAGTSSLSATVVPYQRFTLALAGTSSLAATVSGGHPAPKTFSPTFAGTSALTGVPIVVFPVGVAGTSVFSGTLSGGTLVNFGSFTSTYGDLHFYADGVAYDVTFPYAPVSQEILNALEALESSYALTYTPPS